MCMCVCVYVCVYMCMCVCMCVCVVCVCVVCVYVHPRAICESFFIVFHILLKTIMPYIYDASIASCNVYRSISLITAWTN